MIIKIKYFLELIAVKLALTLFRILGIKNASNFGSFLARKIGKRLEVQNLARSNLKSAMPLLKDQQIEQTLDDMWDNLGRICGEFVHICKLDQKDLMKYVKINEKTAQNLKYIKEKYNGGIIFSAHTGNWEIGPKSFLANNFNVKSIYRELNNVMVDNITSKARNVEMIAKNSKGNKQIISEIKKGNYIIIMVDQKITGGLDVPFFHKNALTSPSPAKLALKYKLPLIPARIIRKNKKFQFEFRVDNIIEPSINYKNDEETTIKITQKINKIIESWVTEYPEQWFWVHDRWKR